MSSTQTMKLVVTLSDAEAQEISINYSDLVKYDVLRARKNFPKREESEFLFMGIVTYAAMIRTGKVQGIEVDKFLEKIEAIEPVETEDEADFPVSESD